MSLSGAIRAGAAYVELFADKNPLTRTLTAAKAEMGGWAGSLKNLGGGVFGGAIEKIGEFVPFHAGMKLMASPAGMFGGMLALAKSAAESGDDINDLSTQTGIAIEKLGSLRYAATQTGLGDEGLAGIVFRLQGEIAKAANEGGEAAEKFAKFGLSAQSLMAMSPDEQLRAIATRLAEVTDKTQRAAMARELLGKGGGKALPFLMELTELEARAKELGFDKINAETAAAGEEFNKLLGDVKLLGKGTMSAIGNAVIPVLRSYVETIIRGAVFVRDWVKEHKGLIQTAFKASAVIVGLGGSVMVAGFAMGKIASLAGTAVAGIKLIGSAASLAMNGLSLVMSVPSLLATGFAALASPVGLFVLGLVGIGVALGAGLAAWLAWTESGQATLAELRGAWDTFKGDMLDTWGGIVDAIGAGDLGLAWEIALAGMSLEWGRFVSYFKDAWSSVKFVLLSTFSDTWASTRSGFSNLVTWMQSLWSSFKAKSTSVILDLARVTGQVMNRAGVATGLMTQEEANARMQRFDKNAGDFRNAANQENADRQAELEREYQADLANIEAERRAEQNANGNIWNEERRQREADLAAKKAALDELRAKAKQAKEEEKPGASESGGAGGRGGALAGPSASAGSFSSATAGMLGGGGPIQTLVEVGRDALQVQRRNEDLLRKIAVDGGMI